MPLCGIDMPRERGKECSNYEPPADELSSRSPQHTHKEEQDRERARRKEENAKKLKEKYDGLRGACSVLPWLNARQRS